MLVNKSEKTFPKKIFFTFHFSLFTYYRNFADIKTTTG